MPELNVFITPEDFLDIAEGCLAAGCRLIPDCHYDSPNYRELRTIEEIRQELPNPWLQGWFVVSQRWERCPLEMGSFERDGNRRYSVMQRNGGPTLDIFHRRPVKKPNGTLLPATLLAYYSTFWNWHTEENERPSEELVACYQLLTRKIKQNSYRVQPMKHIFWISHRAAKSGMRLGPPLEAIDPATLS
jgi:hypothetical protein